MIDELRLVENVKNRRLVTWLTEVEYESFLIDWQNQRQIIEELDEKPDELKRYEDKLKKQFLTTAEQRATEQKESTVQLRTFSIAVRAYAKRH